MIERGNRRGDLLVADRWALGRRNRICITRQPDGTHNGVSGVAIVPRCRSAVISPDAIYHQRA